MNLTDQSLWVFVKISSNDFSGNCFEKSVELLTLFQSKFYIINPHLPTIKESIKVSNTAIRFSIVGNSKVMKSVTVSIQKKTFSYIFVGISMLNQIDFTRDWIWRIRNQQCITYWWNCNKRFFREMSLEQYCFRDDILHLILIKHFF